MLVTARYMMYTYVHMSKFRQVDTFPRGFSPLVSQGLLVIPVFSARRITGRSSGWPTAEAPEVYEFVI